MEAMECEQSADTAVVKEKKRKPGIIYLSTIPTGFNPLRIRNHFSDFGKVGRMFLQTSKDEKSKHKSKKTPQYTEGWVEFMSKRKAKWVTMMLNSKTVGGKKKDPCYDELWNIKYLPRFKWAFLNQRLEYERESYRQGMVAAISQVRQQADHFIKVAEISEIKKKKEKKKKKLIEENGDTVSEKVENVEESATVQNMEKNTLKPVYVFKQKETEGEIKTKKDKKQKDAEIKRRIAEKKKRKEVKKLKKMKDKIPDEDFLGSIFVGSAN